MNTTSDDNVEKNLNDVFILLFRIITWSLLPIGMLGIITNGLNVAVYAMIGFQDNIFLCFFVMSVFDLFFIMMISNTNVFNIIKLFEPRLLYYFDISELRLPFYADMLFDISACVKTFIAVQRGCCVVFPFHVNRVFTRKRTAAIIVCLCLLSLANYVSDEFMKVRSAYTDPLTNQTQYYLIYYERSLVADRIRRIFNKTFVICACDILIMLSFIAIVYGMSTTPKWRQSSLAGKVKTLLKSKPWVKINSLLNRNKKDVSNNFKNCTIHGNIPKQQKILKNSRELRVVKQVVLISALHLICYTPAAICAIAYETKTTRFFSVQVYHCYVTITLLLQLIGPLNATINFFIYQTYNYKFRRALLKICTRIHEDSH